jgi:hypothetical protein
VKWPSIALTVLLACRGSARDDSAPVEPPWPPTLEGAWVRACEVHELCADALRGCRAGDDTWCLALGSALEGYGGPRDMVAALSVYLATCDHRVAEACSQAALALALESPDERAHIRGLHERACTGGALHSCGALFEDHAASQSVRAAAETRLRGACEDGAHEERAWACATLRGEPSLPPTTPPE